MKIQIKILAIVTAALMLLPLLGCLVPKGTEPAAEPTAANGAVPAPDGAGTDAPADEAAFDKDAIAIELGDIQITAEEVQNTFDQYVNYFAYGYGMDEESLEQFMRMTEEWLIEARMPEWKAAELGVTLSAEEEAACSADAQAEVDEERDSLLCYYGDPEGMIEDVTLLTDEQKAEAIETIDGELAMMFGEGFSFEDYLAMRYADILKGVRADAYTALLEERAIAGVTVDDAAIDAWYEKELDDQKSEFDEDPVLFLDRQNGRSLDESPLCLYVPADAARLEIICIPADESAQARIDENTLRMTELEAEYGALKLNGKDEERQAEIETEYAALRAETETLKTEQDGKASGIAKLAYDALNGGMTFEAAMDQYNAHDEGESGSYEWTVFTDGSETEFPALAEAAAKLEAGAYSEPIPVDGDYYIIRLKEIRPKGAVDRASLGETLRAAAAEGLREEARQTQHDAWLEEAKTAAVYHRETYEMLISMYLG